LRDIPVHVQRAFISAEDKRFYQHKGVDERSLIRAFIGNLAQSGRPQGGSTITQQVVKNILVGEDVTYERKIREMVLAARIEQTLTKAEILELYLNSTFLGRGSGAEMAARSYFGKSSSELTVAEGAFRRITKGPNSSTPNVIRTGPAALRLYARPHAGRPGDQRRPSRHLLRCRN
jgi:membrane carboxypeptidase/penicillin-binding protein